MGVKRNHLILLITVFTLLVILWLMSSRSKKKRGKKSVRENFIDQTMKEDNSTFSLFNWGNNDENYESYENETVENFPQATPMNVIYTDTNGNLSNTSDLGLQNLTVNSDTKIVGNTTVNGVLTSTNAGVEINGADLGGPNANTRINSQGIIFGGANNGRESNSAQITAGRHRADTLCIVGMSNSAMQNRKIEMWAEGGTTHNGSIQLNGNISSSSNVSASESVNGKSVNATESVNGKSVNASESVSAKTLNVSTIKIGNCVLTEGDGGSLRISNGNGYIDIGTQNGGWGHIYTDRAKFAFNKPLTDVANSPYKDYAKYDKENTNDITVGKVNANTISASNNISGGKMCVGNTCITDKELKYLTTGFYIQAAHLPRSDNDGSRWHAGENVHMWSDGVMRTAGPASAFNFAPVNGV